MIGRSIQCFRSYSVWTNDCRFLYIYRSSRNWVHGTTITVLNACRKIDTNGPNGKLFFTSGLGGMSGAWPKAGNIAGVISVTAEINPKASYKRHKQGWVDEIISDLEKLCERVKKAKKSKEIVSIAYDGNIVDVWEKFNKENIYIDLGSDQTSLHNPWAGRILSSGVNF